MDNPEQRFCYRPHPNSTNPEWPYHFITAYRSRAEDEAGYNPYSQIDGQRFAHAAAEWCEEQFGHEHVRWTRHNTSYLITFRHEVDAAAFKMRWG